MNPRALAQQKTPRRRTRNPRRGGGFTLLELVAVIVIVAVLAAVSVPSLEALTGSRQALARNEVVRDLTFARQRSVAKGLPTWVDFDLAGNRYSLLEEDPEAPGFDGARAIDDPATGEPLVRTFGAGEYREVALIEAIFDDGAALGFDWLGRPLNATGADLAADGRIELSGMPPITIEVESGYVE